MTENIAWQVPVAAWQVWNEQSQQGERKPDLAFVEPMLRRRLSPLARAALHVANVCSQGRTAVDFVYASRHGELERTVELLHNLARDEALSPTVFSLSVLNSAPGVFAIARNDHSPAIAVSAGTETFGFGLLEACARARLEPGKPVLYIYADAPAPAPLGHQSGDPEAIFALAMLIDAAAPTALEVAFSPQAAAGDSSSQAQSCLRALGGQAENWSSGRRVWHWSLR